MAAKKKREFVPTVLEGEDQQWTLPIEHILLVETIDEKDEVEEFPNYVLRIWLPGGARWEMNYAVKQIRDNAALDANEAMKAYHRAKLGV